MRKTTVLPKDKNGCSDSFFFIKTILLLPDHHDHLDHYLYHHHDHLYHHLDHYIDHDGHLDHHHGHFDHLDYHLIMIIFLILIITILIIIFIIIMIIIEHTALWYQQNPAISNTLELASTDYAPTRVLESTI